MSAEEFADRIVTVGVPLLVVIVLLAVVALVGAVVEWRRKWPHGRNRTCGNVLCECSRSFAAALKRREGLL